MFNQFFITGILVSMPSSLSHQNDYLIYLKVKKPYDEYDPAHNYVMLPVLLWPGLARRISDEAVVGSILEVKGRLLNKAEDVNTIILKAESCQVLDYDLQQLMKKKK